ncbi:hypothetical protein SESBI_08128 [Sesbania bispinosa]|nr:hypothetical protein SESBI_08128 [Sesbania bispinosa]
MERICDYKRIVQIETKQRNRKIRVGPGVTTTAVGHLLPNDYHNCNFAVATIVRRSIGALPHCLTAAATACPPLPKLVTVAAMHATPTILVSQISPYGEEIVVPLSILRT